MNDDPEIADSDQPALNKAGKPMGFFDHIEELRGTLVKCAVALVICCAFTGFYFQEFRDVLYWPLRTVEAEVQAGDPTFQLQLVTSTVMQGFTVVFQICLLGGGVLASPFVLFFIGQFVAPALTDKEKRLVLPIVVSGLLLFLIGAAFAFFLLMPSTIRVSVAFNNLLGSMEVWTLAAYFGLLAWFVLGVGAAFEFPLVIVFLVWMGVLTTGFLRKYRRHAIVLIFIIAAIVTPTPDPVTQTMFAVPLYILFEIAVFVSARVEKRKSAL